MDKLETVIGGECQVDFFFFQFIKKNNFQSIKNVPMSFAKKQLVQF